MLLPKICKYAEEGFKECTIHLKDLFSISKEKKGLKDLNDGEHMDNRKTRDYKETD